MLNSRIHPTETDVTYLDPIKMDSFSNLYYTTSNSQQNVEMKQTLLENNTQILSNRIQLLLHDNKLLNHQLKILTERNEHLQKVVESSHKQMLNDINNQDKITKIFKDVETSFTEQLSRDDKCVQISSLCELCQGKIECLDFEGPSIIMKKAEIEKLEHDMKVLRDVYVAREEAWRESSENEKTYRHQISDLLLEIITYRHNLECRNRELENFHQDLVHKKIEIQELRREVGNLKQQIGRLKCRSAKKDTPKVVTIEDMKVQLMNSKKKRELTGVTLPEKSQSDLPSLSNQ